MKEQNLLQKILEYPSQVQMKIEKTWQQLEVPPEKMIAPFQTYLITQVHLLGLPGDLVYF